MQLSAAKLDDGRIGGTVEIDQSQRVLGTPFPVFVSNRIVGDVTCYAQAGPRATAVFAVDPARTSVSFGSPASAYAVHVYDGGPGAADDGFSYEPVSGDLTTCTPPAADTGFATPSAGDGYTVGQSTP